ncbi:DNA mismatch repair protein Mlh1-like [Cyclospora cayetanensis]|uniref:DNA mismatch repair protein Mlh1-like n=1 Tax=Cyclospora cayetanensis TaxID=88456 RepID=A0A6P6S4F2_9EIME|nr:DNA mismatch repair protein Mlh1-like [Cyclospora cayetanensis]
MVDGGNPRSSNNTGDTSLMGGNSNSNTPTPRGSRIRLLPDDVVRRIAAGEVVSRPAAALKELLENSLDAGALRVSVHCVGGGLRLLQVADDGSGIAAADLPLLCARHCTSKLQTLQQLQHISSFGFRGEALAALSLVSKLAVTTRVRGERHGFSCTYTAGVLAGNPEPLARTGGTTLKATDLFYCVPARRRIFLSSSPASGCGSAGTDEYLRCLHVVGRYAINNPHVSFTLRRQQQQLPDISTHAFGLADAKKLLIQLQQHEQQQEQRQQQHEEQQQQQRGSTCSCCGGEEEERVPTEEELRLLRGVTLLQGGALRVIETLHGTAVSSTLLPIHLRRPLPAAAMHFIQSQKQPQQAEEAPQEEEETQSRLKELHGSSGRDRRHVCPLLRKLVAKLTAADAAAAAIFLEELPEDEWRLAGFLSAAHSGAKKGSFCCFINGRLVDCPVLKRSVDAVYGQLMPRGQRPWVYLCLELPAVLVDVNVHPSKSQVRFLHEEFIAEVTASALMDMLKGKASSKSLPMHQPAASVQQAELKQQKLVVISTETGDVPRRLAREQQGEDDLNERGNSSSTPSTSTSSNSSNSSSSASRKQPLNPTRTRTDARQLPLSAFWQQATSTRKEHRVEQQQHQDEQVDGSLAMHSAEAAALLSPEAPLSAAQPAVSQQLWHTWGVRLFDERREKGGHVLDSVAPCSGGSHRGSDAGRLRSVRQLLQLCAAAAVQGKGSAAACSSSSNSHKDSALQESSYVGAVNTRMALLHSGESLLLVNLPTIAKECVYQSILRRLGRLPVVRLQRPVDLQKALFAALQQKQQEQQQLQQEQQQEQQQQEQQQEQQQLQQEEQQGEQQRKQHEDEEYRDEATVRRLCATLLQRRALLADYFGIIIGKDCCLLGVPLCCGKHVPHPRLLRCMLLRLATEVDWKEESACLHGICDLLAEAYTTVEEAADAVADEAGRSATCVASARKHPRLTMQQEAEHEREENKEQRITPPPTRGAAPCWCRAVDIDQHMAASAETRRMFSNVLMPALRFSWKTHIPKRFYEDGTVKELTSLKALYRVFERC